MWCHWPAAFSSLLEHALENNAVIAVWDSDRSGLNTGRTILFIVRGAISFAGVGVGIDQIL